MSAEPYQTLAGALAGVGLSAQYQNKDQLVVTSQVGPVWPNGGNSFWLSQKLGTWYLSTWSPVGYRIPPGQDLVGLCSACMSLGKGAMYRVPPDIAAQFGLQELSVEEYDQVFPETPQSD
jgi:hypothetical protein